MSASFWGLDVSGDWLDLAHCDSFVARFANDSVGIKKLLKHLAAFAHIQCVALEASGGYEFDAYTALLRAGLPASRVEATRVRFFAKATNCHAKTDAIDAVLLARFAQATRPRIGVLPSEAQLKLAQLVDRRQQLVEMRKREKQRIQKPTALASEESFDAVMQVLNAQIKRIEQKCQQLIEEDEQLAAKSKRLRSCPGVGKALTLALLAQLPELGELNNKQIAALVGVAPFDNSSGKVNKTKHIKAGRKQLRQTLFMAAFAAGYRHNAQLKVFYERLLSKGKHHRVAVTACARKLLTWLNSMLKHQRDFDPTLLLSDS